MTTDINAQTGAHNSVPSVVPGAPAAAPGQTRGGTGGSGWPAALVGIFLAAGTMVAVAALLWSWEFGSRAVTSGEAVPASLFGWHLHPTPDLAAFCVVAAASAMGSMVHAVMSFTTYVGNQQFRASWVPWYLLRAPLGISLALVLYAAVRAGFVVAGPSTSGTTMPWAAALGGMTGLFAKQASDKLEEIFDTVFRTGPGYGDSTRKDSSHPSSPAAP